MGRFAQRTRSLAWRRWPLVGLLLALAFLGHDLLMAADAKAEGSADHSPAVHHRTAIHPETDAADPLRIESWETNHPAGCEVGMLAAPPTGGDPDLLAGLAAIDGPITATVAPLAHCPGAAWGEPTWPPGTRRALVQVYRI